GDDEVAVLSRAFNRMTAQVKRQRDALVAVNAETEQRRRFIETVLSGVSAGVVGVDSTGRIELINAAAADMLGLRDAATQGASLAQVSPVLAPLLSRVGRTPGGAAQDQIRVSHDGDERELLARVTPKGADPSEGAVVTLDDLTELVSAQRMAAWGDIARRIAHEIKNPLTPIQLSADRLKRKFRSLGPEDRAALDQYADVIARQAGDIRRMVDEFSRFARMPEPQTRDEDVEAIVRDAVLLQDAAETDVRHRIAVADAGPVARCDRGLLSQALTNLLKNATEAVQARLAQAPDGPAGEVRTTLRVEDGRVVIEIADNGVGLPQTDRARLTEPYVTTRARGTGLGLAIVKKIVEQHGGVLTLTDAEPFTEGATPGALARVSLPLSPAQTEMLRIA
ncbi:MAG: PAS domain-containing sensor histidine kinase, partial [Alphaproteobacteria bacterium HGW-Alphaproteobacteria-8]